VVGPRAFAITVWVAETVIGAGAAFVAFLGMAGGVANLKKEGCFEC
jgi:hypothetical protein